MDDAMRLGERYAAARERLQRVLQGMHPNKAVTVHVEAIEKAVDWLEVLDMGGDAPAPIWPLPVGPELPQTIDLREMAREGADPERVRELEAPARRGRRGGR